MPWNKPRHKPRAHALGRRGRFAISRIASKRPQLGYADGLVGLMTLIVYGIAGLVLLVVAISIFLPLRFLKGKWGVAVAALVLVAWGIAGTRWHTENVSKPLDLRNWRSEAVAKCEMERKQLPAAIEVDSFLDTTASLKTSSLIHLLVVRQLSFVEVKLSGNPAEPPRIAVPDAQYDSVWRIKPTAKPYARIELSQVGDPRCIDPPSEWSSRLQLPPFLPGTCLAASPVDEPGARHVLALSPEADQARRQFGTWMLTDAKTGESLVRLTTSDTNNSVGSGVSGEVFRPLPEGVINDCRAAHNVIASRFDSPAHRPGLTPHSGVVLEVAVLANPAPESLAREDASIGVVASRAEKVTYDKAQQDIAWMPSSSAQVWINAVTQAREHGFGGFGSRLLDWEARKLVQLSPGNHEWSQFAIGDGFLVLEHQAAKTARIFRLLRYDRGGKLVWSSRVSPPANADPLCDRYETSWVYQDASHLVLAGRCNIGTLTREEWDRAQPWELWKISRRELPGRL